jgi:hypothetical protein
MTSPPGAADLVDPRWFAVDLHVPERWFAMLRVDDDAIARSSFLDNRIEAPLAQAAPMPVAAAPPDLPRAPVGWLFHTSFCASTLLARALHLAPHAVALKEPFVLRRLSDARHAGRALDGLIAPSVALLARPWHPGGAVVIKPTHVALNLALDLLDATPGSRAVIATCSLEEFLISNLKKPAASQAKIGVLAERMLRASGFAQRLPAAALSPPDALCAAGLQWAATRELVHDVVAAAGAERARVLDMQLLLDDLPAVAADCAHWLGLPTPPDAQRAHAAAAGTRNAKALDVPYGTDRRAYEADIVVHHHGPALRNAAAWTRTHVVAAMRPAAVDPAPWPAPLDAAARRRTAPRTGS